ncbi:MAG TPA: CaiB/BaiF CoA-transferase family protein [Myxococcota bacterium]|nr:CaiB/BaiF CoA-transferase family protein [Myxococcota bacterium]
MSTTLPPLSGLRILDLTRLFPGPLATMILGDLGADVIKIEDPAKGDLMRYLPPQKNGIGQGFLALNRSKRSLALDLKSVRGRDLFLDLVRKSDVVVEGFRPGVIERLGLGYSELKRARADIILCSISGYGQTGPYRLRAGHDINYCARAGVLGASGERDGPPMMPGVQIADVGGGTWQALAAIMGALFARERSGRGQWLDVSMTDGVLTTALLAMQNVLAGEQPPERGEAPLAGGLPGYGIFATKDGKHMAAGAIEPQFFAALCDAVGRPHLRDLGACLGEEGRQVKRELSEAFSGRNQSEWVEIFSKLDACVEPVQEGSDVLEDEQLTAREMFFEMEHPAAGKITQMASPLRLAGCRKPNLPPPALGQHTAEILAELGLDPEDVNDLAGRGVCGIGRG